MKPTTDKLIGLFGHLLDPQGGRVKHKFEIVSCLNETLYLAKLFSPLDLRHNGDMRIIPLNVLADYGACRLYCDRDRWVKQVDQIRPREVVMQQMAWLDSDGNELKTP